MSNLLESDMQMWACIRFFGSIVLLSKYKSAIIKALLLYESPPRRMFCD